MRIQVTVGSLEYNYGSTTMKEVHVYNISISIVISKTTKIVLRVAARVQSLDE